MRNRNGWSLAGSFLPSGAGHLMFLGVRLSSWFSSPGASCCILPSFATHLLNTLGHLVLFRRCDLPQDCRARAMETPARLVLHTSFAVSAVMANAFSAVTESARQTEPTSEVTYFDLTSKLDDLVCHIVVDICACRPCTNQNAEVCLLQILLARHRRPARE